MKGFCDGAENNCNLVRNFVRLYWATIYAMIIGIPLYFLFVKTIVIYLHEERVANMESKLTGLRIKKK